MAGPNYMLAKGWVAATAIPKYTFVDLSANETVSAIDSQGVIALGVAQEETTTADATNGRVVNVALHGISRVIAGATIAQGNFVTPGADGRAEVAASGDVIVGRALQAAVDGDHMDVVLMTSGTVVA